MTELTEAEIERLCGLYDRVAPFALLDEVAAIIDARLAPIRALADKWHGSGSCSPSWCYACRLGAALETTSAPVSAQQDPDGTEGQGEGEEALTPGREVRFGVVLDDQGSTDEYDTYDEARTALDKWGGDGIVRIERTVALWLEESR